jgi:hypothetical protein
MIPTLHNPQLARGGPTSRRSGAAAASSLALPTTASPDVGEYVAPGDLEKEREAAIALLREKGNTQVRISSRGNEGGRRKPAPLPAQDYAGLEIGF